MQTTGTCLQVLRENNSRSGNPRYMIVVGDMPGTADVFYTPVNAGWVYGVNWESLAGKQVRVTHRLVRGRNTAENIAEFV